MDDQKKQIIEKLKQANNILVTVKSDPTIDQLSACIGLTLILNELGKHATAVFSGEVPSVLEFLQPEKTLETNTDSLRDFIIALDKSKADKLRYKVEDKVVKIFITPYKTSISDQDLEFSQGDFNVDVVVALGVHEQDELDQAITEHGRILHDATVVSVTTDDGEKLGSINWLGTDVSSLSEMITGIADQLGKKDVLDNQIATALLTGIVSETERFSNNKTTPQTMSVSAKLLTAGANQELVASKLAEPTPEPAPVSQPESFDHNDTDENPSNGGSPKPSPSEPPRSNDGMLSIDHSHDEVLADEQPQQSTDEPAEDFTDNEQGALPEDRQLPETKSIELPRAEAPQAPPVGLPEDEQAALDLLKNRQIQVDEHGTLQPIETEHRDFLGDNNHPLLEQTPVIPDPEENPAGAPFDLSKFALTPPTMGGTLTANSRPEGYEPSTDPLSTDDSKQHILSHERPGGTAKDRDDSESADAVSQAAPVAQTLPPAPEPPKPKLPEQPPEPVVPEQPKYQEPFVDKPAPVAVPELVQTPVPEQPSVAISAAVPTPTATATLSASAPTPAPESVSAPEPLIAPAFSTPIAAVEQTVPKTLAELERELHSAHVAEQMVSTAPEAPLLPPDLAPATSEAHPDLQAALQDTQATPTPLASTEFTTEPITTPGGQLQAQPLSSADMAPPAASVELPSTQPTPQFAPTGPAPELQAQTLDMPLPSTVNIPTANPIPPTSSPATSPTAPPPVPPPMVPRFTDSAS